jgi:hypothetical protein
LDDHALRSIGFWSTIAAEFGEDVGAFKDAVLKDLEVVSIIGGLYMTIAFAALSVDFGESGSELIAMARLAYLVCVFLSVALSTAATCISVRTILLLNTAPATRTLDLLSEVGARRLHSSLHPFNILLFTHIPLFLSACIYTAILHGPLAGLVGTVIFVATLGYLRHEDQVHLSARLACASPSKKKSK